MSRADKEKALYIIRLHQIKDELRQKYPNEFNLINQQQKQQDLNKMRDQFEESLTVNQTESVFATNFSHKMHGQKALQQIEEKINDELLSNDEDEDEADNLQSSEYTLKSEHQQ